MMKKKIAASSLVVFGALAMLAVGCPGKSFDRYKCKSVQAQVKMELQTLHGEMEEAKALEGKYPSELPDFTPETDTYEYVLVSSTDDTFVIEGRGSGDMDTDVWQIDQDGNFSAVSDACN